MEIDVFENLFNECLKNDTQFEQLNFLWKLMRSPHTQYHYSLMIREDISEQFRKILWSRFDEHGENAEEILISKLEHSEDALYHGDMIFLLGKIADTRNSKNKDKILNLVKQSSTSPDDYLRDRAIIVLGWIGTNAELPILIDRLQNDKNSKCRAWAASSFMQMDFRLKRKGLSVDEGSVITALHEAMINEDDYFALGTYIFVLQEITGKNFRLSHRAAECIDVEKIEKSKKSALNFLKKWENSVSQ